MLRILINLYVLRILISLYVLRILINLYVLRILINLYVLRILINLYVLRILINLYVLRILTREYLNIGCQAKACGNVWACAELLKSDVYGGHLLLRVMSIIITLSHFTRR